MFPCFIIIYIKFLSTLSLRRATHRNKLNRNHRTDFYPRSPCGERLDNRVTLVPHQQISIHALLAESDHYGWSWYDDFTISIHALLAESDTETEDSYKDTVTISIHALLAESDRWVRSRRLRSSDFYPRSLVIKLPLRSAISIHALLAESDP